MHLTDLARELADKPAVIMDSTGETAAGLGRLTAAAGRRHRAPG